MRLMLERFERVVWVDSDIVPRDMSWPMPLFVAAKFQPQDVHLYSLSSKVRPPCRRRLQLLPIAGTRAPHG